MGLRGSRALSALLVSVLPLLPVAGGIVASFVAQPAAHAEPSNGEKEAARKLMIRGLDQKKNGALKEALESFRAANEIMHVPTTAVEVARTQRALGHWLDARDTAQAALRVPARPSEPAPFKEARAEMSALVDEVTAALPAVVISVTGVPPGVPATVTLDGAQLPPSALDTPRKVDPGHHIIDGKAGDTLGRVELELSARQSQRVVLALRFAGSPVAAPPAQESQAGAASGGDGPKKKTDALKVLEVACFAAGGVGLATGVVTGILSLSETSHIRSVCGSDDCPLNVYDSLRTDREVAHTTANIATAGFIVAGAGAALGVTALLLRNHKKADASGAPQASVSWVVGPGLVAGSF